MLMKMVEIPPPGTWCQNEALWDIIGKVGAKRFIEVGCGAGELSAVLCDRGMAGCGIDFSPRSLEQAEQRLFPHLQMGRYRLIEGDFQEMKKLPTPADIAVSMMVVEHIEDDDAFVRKLTRLVHSGGHVIVGAPGRKAKWSFEDQTVGHLRRYERSELKDLLEKARLVDVQVWSVSVPVANLLFGLGNVLARKAGEGHKKAQSQRDQTQTSGIRRIPFKTVFPSFFRVLLNRWTLRPLFWIQRLFYRSNWGLTLIAFGRVA